MSSVKVKLWTNFDELMAAHLQISFDAFISAAPEDRQSDNGWRTCTSQKSLLYLVKSCLANDLWFSHDYNRSRKQKCIFLNYVLNLARTPLEWFDCR